MHWRWVGFFVVAVSCGLACGGDDDGTTFDGGGCDPTSCDDGLFCNGTEACIAGACSPGAPPCTGVLLCNESMDRCESPGCDFPDADEDGVESALCGGADCDDADADRFPGNTEVCDLVDQDCDPTTLGGRDADGDGFEDAMCCNGADCGPDCDDSDPAVRPDAAELCNDIDDDCDGGVDEGVLRQFFVDEDGDGFGAADSPVMLACFRMDGISDNDRDCDDEVAAINPSALEQCDGLDNDCNGITDDPETTALTCTARFGSPPNTFFACDAGDCTIPACADGFANCNGERSDGCEVDTRADVNHCGACGSLCGVAGVCTAGMCDGVVDIGLGHGFGCARRGTVDEPGPVVCWGRNDFGQLGDGTTIDRRTPVATGVRALDVEGSLGLPVTTFHPECPFACAFDGRLVQCWGCNRGGQMGNNMNYAIEVRPTAVRGIPPTVDDTTDPVERLTVGGGHACIRKVSGLSPQAGLCWGEGANFGTDDSSPDPYSMPSAFGPVDQVFAGNDHTCTLDLTGAAHCLGSNRLGELGDPGFTGTRSTSYRDVAGGHRFVELSLGHSTSCGIRMDGRAYCWGNNADGQLGRGNTTSPARTPARVGTLEDVEDIAIGFSHACALSGGAVSCWGSNDVGQLGDGSFDSSSSPVEVLGIDDAIAVDVGRSFSCAIRSDGDVWCWGSGADGQLGDVPEAMRNEPAPVPGL